MKSLPSAPAPSHASLTKAMDPSELPLGDLCATQQLFNAAEAILNPVSISRQ